MRNFLIVTFLLFCLSAKAQKTKFISAYGYEGCILIENKDTRVILNPYVGGSVLEYSLNGKNILFENPKMNGRIWQGDNDRFEVPGGRMDIGPEKTTPFRESFFNIWKGEITGKYSARMTSPVDTALGVQLIRDFALDSVSSKLTCTQTIKNISDQTQTYAHWSRTFAKGGGICLVPLKEHRRLPHGYAIYRDQKTIDFDPQPEENVRVRNEILEILGPPSNPKFAVESDAGWIAYLHQSDLIFVKTFPVYKGQLYGDMLAEEVSIWYYKDEKCEIEPIGPLEKIGPGKTASFTETWYLKSEKFPEDRNADLKNIQKTIKNLKVDQI